jgi:hypothetical protein
VVCFTGLLVRTVYVSRVRTVLRSTLRSVVAPAVVVLRDCDVGPLRSVYDLEAELEAMLRHAPCIALFHCPAASISPA